MLIKLYGYKLGRNFSCISVVLLHLFGQVQLVVLNLRIFCWIFDVSVYLPKYDFRVEHLLWRTDFSLVSLISFTFETLNQFNINTSMSVWSCLYATVTQKKYITPTQSHIYVYNFPFFHSSFFCSDRISQLRNLKSIIGQQSSAAIMTKVEHWENSYIKDSWILHLFFLSSLRSMTPFISSQQLKCVAHMPSLATMHSLTPSISHYHVFPDLPPQATIPSIMSLL